MSPTTRSAAALAGIALAACALLAALAVDARLASRPVRVERRLPPVLARGVATPLVARADAPGRRAPRLRQAAPPDLAVEPREADGELRAHVIGRRRGRHTLPGVATRAEGPLGLAAWHHRRAGDEEVLVYPDLPAARALALAVRRGRFREPGRISRGPLGLGTEFESVRDYSPDDDIRQVNWLATARVGRPMSNSYRIEQDRELVCLLDAGRLMGAPAGGAGVPRTRLDAAVDAATAVALVADELGDRVGAIAFDARLRRVVRPRHKGADAVVRAIFDVEPRATDADYEAAFRAVGGAKRALVLVLTDLLDESAARSLLEALPVLARRHHIVVATAADPDLQAAIAREPTDEVDVYEAAAALDVLAARERATLQLRRAGADVLEAAPDRLAAACVAAYLDAKRRVRL